MPAASAAPISPTEWPTIAVGARPTAFSAAVEAASMAKISGCETLVSASRASRSSANSASLSDQPASGRNRASASSKRARKTGLRA